MKIFFVLASLLAAHLAQGQCAASSFVLSPAVGKSPGSGVSVNLEAGYLPYLAKTYASVKTSLWTETKTLRFTNSKGEAVAVEKSTAAGFVGLNLGYAPAAFEESPRKWLFGAAPGLLFREGEKNRAAAQFSAAYTVRLAAADYRSGLACLKLEGNCLVSGLGVKPGISAGVFLVL